MIGLRHHFIVGNMNFSSQVSCPQCQHKFSLSDEFQKDIEQKLGADMQKKQAQWEVEKQKLESEKLQAEKNAEEKAQKAAQDQLQKEKIIMWEKAQKIAQEQSDTRLKDLESQNSENKKRLQEAQQKELDFMKKERNLEEKAKNIELEMQKKMLEERKTIESQVKKDAEESHRLKLLEKDKQMEQLKKSLDEAQRRAEQGSMQIQGDVQEDDLRDMLRAEFPSDDIADVPTGVRGADIIQTVKTPFGQKAGVILWESKNTKSWTEGWIQKLKDDQANLGADVSILVSQTLPEGVEQYEFRNGVWVVGYAFVNALVSLLRFHILEVGNLKTSLQGKDEKMNMLYEYLSSPQFKNRIENIVDAFSSMKSDLDAEKRAFQKHWNKREKQLERVMMNTSGFYGDLQGIAGNSISKVDALELGEGDDGFDF